MRKFSIYLFTLVALSFVLVNCKKDGKEPPVKDGVALVKEAVNPPTYASGGSDNQCSPSGESARPLASYTFGPTVPNSLFWNFSLTEASNIEFFMQDCCIRDDVIEVYIDGCLVATVDSRGGDYGTHPGETFTVTVGAGDHVLEYRNTVSEPGESGWYISETILPATEVVIDGCATGVPNLTICDGSATSFNEAIAACAASASNHGQFVSCVSALTNAWKTAGLITGAEKGKIMSCVAKSN